MKQYRMVSLKLPEDLIGAVERAAHSQGCSPAEVIRAVLASAFRQTPRKDAPGPDDLAAILRAFADAAGWLDLQTRLRAAGFVLRLNTAGRLALHSWPQDRFLTSAEAVGQSLARLSLRFRAPFPGALPVRQPPDQRSVIARPGHRAS